MKYLTKTLVRSLFALLLSSLSSWAVVTIDPPTRTFTKDGGGGSILTAGSGTWTASANVAWLTLTPRTTGSAGESCIYVVNSNLSADTRQGIVTLNGNTHTVTQTGYSATLSPTNATKDLNGGSGSISITTSAGVAWTAVSNAPWITVTPASGISNGSVAYTVATHAGVVSRTGSLTIAGKTFTVTQTGADVNLAPKSVDKAYSSDIVQIQVSALSTTLWSVTPQSPWISVIDDGNGFGDSTVTLAISTNPSFADRTGTVNIGTAAFTIQQAGTPNPVLDLLPWTATADPLGVNGNVAVLATPDGPWTAQSLAPWIVIAQGNSGAGNGNIQYVASANPSLTARTGRIRVNPPIYQPQVDLTWLLLAHFDSGNTDLSGWGGSLSRSLGTRFNGLNPPNMGGNFNRATDDSISLCLQFELGDINTVNRILEVTRADGSYSTIYVDAANRLIFRCAGEILTTNLTVVAGTTYQLVLTTDANRLVKVYAAARGGAGISEVGSKLFAVAPFPANYVQPSTIKLGTAQLPTAGNLTNAALSDLRIHGRSLNALEASAIYLNAGTANPYAMPTESGSPPPVRRYRFDGQGLGGVGPVASLSGGWSRTPDRMSLEHRALQSDGSARINFSTMNQNSVTYSFWLKFDTFPTGGAFQNIFIGNQFSNNRGTLALGAGPVLRLYTEYGQTITLPALLQVGQWHHIAVSGEFLGIFRFFVDGEEIGNTSVFANLSPFLGTNSSVLGGWNGAIDEAAVYAGALNSTQIKAIYDAEKPKTFYHTVTQGVVDPAVTPQLVQMPSSGGSSAAVLTLAQNVNWTVSAGSPWISVTSPTEGAGSTTVSFDVAANPTVYQRQGILSVAGKSVTVDQAGLNVSIQHDELVFSTDGGSGWIEVSPEGNGQWQAVSDVSWLTVALGSTGAGQGSVFIVADPYTNTTSSRTGSVTVAGQKVYITQRGYELSISPQVAQIGSNAGAGEFGVAAPLSAVWEAIATQPWITIMGGTSGIGNGTIHYSVAANQTGSTRSGRIIVSGREYTITQVTNLLLTTGISGAGSVSGAGSYDTNAVAVLTATPTTGNVFSHWTGDAVGSANPLNLTMDRGKTVTANFIPAQAAETISTAAVQGVINNPNPYGLFTTNQMHGLALGRPVLDKDPVTGKMNLQLGLTRSSNLTNWSDLSVLPADVGVVGGKLNLQITPEGNAAFYRIEGN